MNQITLYGITGRTELGLNEYIETRPAFEDHGPSYDVHTWRAYTIQAQEDAHLFHLTEEFWNEATDCYFSDVPDDEPNHEPEAYPDPWCAPDYAPCEQQAFVSEADGWTLVTCYDLSSQPTPFKSLELGTEFYDPFTQDMARKFSDQTAIVVASGDPAFVGRTYGFTDASAPMNSTMYPVLPPSAQHLADGWVPEPLATDPPAARADQKMVDFMDNYGTTAPLHTPPQDHPEGWDSPAKACMAAYAKDRDSIEVYPLPPSEDPPETQGIPVTYKVPMGNCYRLMHHTRQIAIVPNYAQGETIAQALAATFAGRMADFSLTLDFIEGAAP